MKTIFGQFNLSISIASGGHVLHSSVLVSSWSFEHFDPPVCLFIKIHVSFRMRGSATDSEKKRKEDSCEPTEIILRELS